MKYVNLAARLLGVPLMAERGKVDVILHVLSSRLNLAPRADMFDDDDDDVAPVVEAPAKCFSMTDDGIAVIPVSGSLVKRRLGISAMSGMTSYDLIGKQFDAAVADPDCKGIVLDVDSGGGECSGCFDLCDKIYAGRSVKPVYACANDTMYSAAFAIGSAASVLFGSRTAGVGSIGVIAVHVDQSKADAEDGLKYTYVTFGEKKALLNDHAPLSDVGRDFLNAEVERLGMMFVSAVARNRSMSADAIIAQQAGCFYGPNALAAGLLDQIGTMDDCMAAMRAAIGSNDSEDVPLDVADEGADEDGLPFDGATRHVIVGESASPDLRARIAEAIQGSGFTIGDGATRSVAMTRNGGFCAISGGGTEAYVIDACPVPYNKLSVDLGGFREVYAPGCFTESIARDPIAVLFNHNSTYILGHTKAGTAKFIEKPDGVYLKADIADTPVNRSLVISPMQRKELRGSSAKFYIEKSRWEKRDGERVRVIEKARMVESSIALDPCYADATADLQGSAPQVPAAISGADDSDLVMQIMNRECGLYGRVVEGREPVQKQA